MRATCHLSRWDDPHSCDIQSIFSGNWGDWGNWSSCSANCNLGKLSGETERQRHLLDDPTRPADVQKQPCNLYCPPGNLENFVNFPLLFFSDCSKLKISLRQVSKGHIFELDTNLTRPSNEDVSSVVMVRSHIQAKQI